MESLEKQAKSGDKDTIKQLEITKRLQTHLEEGKAARSFTVNDKYKHFMEDLFLLSQKPVLFACNVSEEDVNTGNRWVETVKEMAAVHGDETVTFCAKIESEIAELEEGEKEAFLDELGIESGGLSRLIRAAYKELGLITFFTAGEKETRAWTIEKGSKAPEAAGTIHSDFERGFIRAETVSYPIYADMGSEKAVRNAGEMRQEGKDYVVKDGDVILFRFNV